MKYGLVILFFLMPYLLVAQSNPILIEGKVTDVLHKPVPYAIVQAIGTTDGCIADAAGNYKFTTAFPTILKASLIGYKTQVQYIKNRTGDTVKIDFVLSIDSTELRQVNVVATHEPQLLREAGTLLDFEAYNGQIWLLNKYRKGEHLEVYDTAMKLHTRIILKHAPDNLYLTPYKYLYMEGSDSVHLLDYDSADKKIDMGGVRADEFRQFVTHLSTYHDPYYYYLWTSFDKCTTKYWYFDHASPGFKILYSYKNRVFERQNMDLIAELYGLNSEETESPIPQAMGEQPEYKIIKGEASRTTWRRTLELKLMLHTTLCPLRIVRDSIYIFNFDNDTINVYDFKNNFIRQVPLTFSLYGIQYKDEDIIVNDEGTTCYYRFTLQGIAYLQKIDLDNGAKLTTEKLQFPFPEKIRIMGGYAYYTYSELGENGMFVRHFYKQKL